MYTLYYAPHTCALASHIALEDAGADYVAKRVDFKSEQQRSPEYLAINPKGRVPALVCPEGILTETPAILAYIAQTFPEARLAPIGDPFALARVQAFNSFICSTLHVNHAHGRRASRWADAPEAIEAMQRKMPETVAAAFDMIEKEMFKGPWVTGDDYSIADAYLFTVALWLEGDKVDTAKLPKIMAHRERMHARPQVAKVLAEERAA